MSKRLLRTVVVLFTRDLRVHDQPALAAASTRAERVVPLFVLDDAVLAAFGAPNRVAFLLDALRDLDALAAAARRRARRAARRRGRRDGVRVAVETGRRGGLRRRGRECLRAGARAPPARRARERPDRARGLPGRDGRAARRPRARRRRPLPRLHAVLAPLAGGAAPERCSTRPSASTCPRAVEPGGSRARRARGGPTAPELPAGRRDRRPAAARRRGSTTGSRATPSSPTTSPPTRPRASRPTSTSAASRPARSSRGRSSARRGAVRPPALLARLQPPAAGRAARDGARGPAAARRRPGATTRTGSRPGAKAARVIPLVDAGMRQLLREGSCTTARASSPARS